MKKGQITIIIPCRNEESNVSNAIQSILENEYPQELIEIIIYDGLSTDNSKSIIESFVHKYPNIQYRENLNKVTPSAFNDGILNSNSEYIQILGSRHVLSKNYIRKAIEILNSSDKIVCVGGGVDLSHQTEKGKTIAKVMNSKFGVGFGNIHSLKKSSFTDTAGAPVFKSWIFSKVGLFDENLIRNQDDEMSYRISKAGFKIFTSLDIQSKYFVRNNFSNLYKQYSQYGYWKVYVNKKNKTITTFRQIIPPIFFAYLFLVVLILPLSFLINIADIYFALIYLPFYSYLIASFLIGLLYNNKMNNIFSFMYCLFLMHAGYGLGYLLGILDFFILNKNPSHKMRELTR